MGKCREIFSYTLVSSSRGSENHEQSLPGQPPCGPTIRADTSEYKPKVPTVLLQGTLSVHIIT
jgi:hypothetical protein